MKIDFALELPTVALEELNPLADFDFAIAYRVLQDDVYAKHYRQRRSGRTLILDNGFHELGHPASWDELRTASNCVHPDFVIVPDNHGPYDALDNLVELEKALHVLPPEYLALVVAGNTYAERTTMVQAALDARVGMLCFSRMVERFAWFCELCKALPMLVSHRIHLLGVSTLDELSAWRKFDVPLRLSVDTSKPAKAALLGRSLNGNTGTSLRGMPVVSRTLFAQPMTPAQRGLCRINIAVLREACGG